MYIVYGVILRFIDIHVDAVLHSRVRIFSCFTEEHNMLIISGTCAKVSLQIILYTIIGKYTYDYDCMYVQYDLQ